MIKPIEEYFDEFPVSDWKIERELGHTTLSYKLWVQEAAASAEGWGLLEEQYEETGEPDDEA